MNCPKCNGGTYIVDEELVKVLENTTPIKLILKVVYLCRSCGERFSRIVYEDIETKKKEIETTPTQTPAPSYQPQQTAEPADDRLRFLDKI